MRFAYADPPYLGCGRLYAKHHPEALAWDKPETHQALIARLCADYPDGWAMSCHTPSLRVLLPFTPSDCRIGSWVKPFAVFKPNVNPAYAWEPVLFRGGRKRDRTQDTARDWHSENITLRKGLPGAKPPKFADWILALLGVDFASGDTIDDIFPGTHGMTLAWKERREPTQEVFAVPQGPTLSGIQDASGTVVGTGSALPKPTTSCIGMHELETTAAASTRAPGATALKGNNR